MDISNLISRKITILNEAEDSRYGIPEKEFELNHEPEPDEDAGDTEDINTEEEESEAEDDNSEEETGEEIDGSNENEQEDEYTEDEDVSDDDVSSIPKLTILNLPEKDKKLNNLKLLKQFNELSRNVSDNLNNNIINITTLNKKQRQILDFVSNNLYGLIEDINNYVLYKFDDVYEENVLTYNIYQKRYRIALELIRQIIDEQSED